MEDDKLIRRIFDDYKPDLGNDDDFMLTFEKKLEMVELVKRHRKTNLRHMKMLLAVTFFLGVLSAVFVVMLISTHRRSCLLILIRWAPVFLCL